MGDYKVNEVHESTAKAYREMMRSLRLFIEVVEVSSVARLCHLQGVDEDAEHARISQD
jgi:hypothetical protein